VTFSGHSASYFPLQQQVETHPSSFTSPSTSKTTLSNPTSSAAPIVRQSTSGQSLKSDLGARPGSLIGEGLGQSVLCPAGPVTLEQEPLDRALQLLPQRERATIQEHFLSTTDDIDSVLQKAFDATQEKQNLCEKKRWTFNFGAHTVKLGEEADKVLLWLDRFKSVGDIAVNVDPIHAGLPWATIRPPLEVLHHGD
jgi:hypothetical protein